MGDIDHDELAAVMSATLEGLGAPAGTAADVAQSLVGANLCGHDSHGVRLLPEKYAPEIEEGKIDPGAGPEIERTFDGGAIVDGRWSFGQVAARTAVDTAVALAEERGVGVVGLRRVSHVGRVGEWAERAAPDAALVAFVANPGSRWVAPPGTAARRLSTNPVAVGVPTYDALPFPIVHDAATSQVAHGKIRQRAAEGTPLPDEWAVDDAGKSIIDPARFEVDGEGAILPLGGRTSGYKGFGLAVVAELLAGIISDGSVSGEDDPLWGNHAAFVAVDPERFSSAAAIEDRIEAFTAYIRSTPSSPSVPVGDAAADDGAVLLPGEAEYRTRRERTSSGIPFPAADREALVELGAAVGIDDDLLSRIAP